MESCHCRKVCDAVHKCNAGDEDFDLFVNTSGVFTELL